jgi:putative addiction module component (TIGR02574 family)
MTAVAERIFKDALGLLPVERAELIEKLFQSFDPPANSKVDAAWAEEVESRMDAYDRGEIKASSAEDVFARINQR